MKILIIRFSSIGDIVLTTPIIRCVAKQIPNAEIHYICKPAYQNLLENNPYINHLHLFEQDNPSLMQELQSQHFDYVIDLQNSFRSKKLVKKLSAPYSTFPKLNIRKWVYVNFKINIMPDVHVVERYFQATKILCSTIENDSLGLDFFIDDTDRKKIEDIVPKQEFIAIAMGSQHATKQLPLSKLIEICSKLNNPIVLLGGKEDMEMADKLSSSLSKDIVNLCGKLSLRESAACIEKSKILLTGDTGLMHIAAALNKPIVSVWGNTVPAFGMYPYMPQHPEKYTIIENKNLRCRPCSKLGFKKCPKKHFNCMNKLNTSSIIELINE